MVGSAAGPALPAYTKQTPTLHGMQSLQYDHRIPSRGTCSAYSVYIMLYTCMCTRTCPVCGSCGTPAGRHGACSACSVYIT